MKPEELMVGDWVKWKDRYVQIARVSGVVYEFGHIDITLAGCNDSGILESHDIKSILPIPLIPEILEKNGFEVNGIPKDFEIDEDGDWYDDTFVWSRQVTPYEKDIVSVYMDDPNNFFVEVFAQYCHADGIHVKYVHELQHALRLCKIEKEIEL